MRLVCSQNFLRRNCTPKFDDREISKIQESDTLRVDGLAILDGLIFLD